MTRHVFEPQSREVIGCAIEVHRALGPGFVESVYHNAMAVSLLEHNIPFELERGVTVFYNAVDVGFHRMDLVVRESIVVELKSVKELVDIHFTQLRSYLRASGLSVGLLFNFNSPVLDIRRVVNRIGEPINHR